MSSSGLEPKDSQSEDPWSKAPVNLAKAVTLAVAIALVIVTFGITLALWGLDLFGRINQATSTVLDVVKLAFALVAGVGGIVGLVLAYRRHQISEESNVRERAKELREDTRLFNERFEKAAGQLGSAEYAVKMAGIYAMSGLADDWEQGRQTCINVLCANLRGGYLPEPRDDAGVEHLAFRQNREFRRALLREIADHLRAGSGISWQGYDFDFRDATFDGIEFDRVVINDSTLDFSGATFNSGTLDFRFIRMISGFLKFHEAKFNSSWLNFSSSKLFGECRDTPSGDRVLDGMMTFVGSTFTSCRLSFSDIEIDGSDVWFSHAGFESNHQFEFAGSTFKAGEIDFFGSRFKDGSPSFNSVNFAGATLSFENAEWDEAPSFDFNPEGVAPYRVLLPTRNTEASQ